MVIIKVTLTRKVIGENRKFSAELFLEDEVTEKELEEMTLKVTKYLCEKGDILNT